MRVTAILLITMTLPLAAQWLDHKEAGTPRGKDGKANLTAPAPRMNGKPDLSGVWQAERTPDSEFRQALGEEFASQQVDLNDATKYNISVFWGLKPGEEPLRPEAVAVMKQYRNQVAPTSRCLPASLPSSLFFYTFKIIQAPRETVMLAGVGDPPRQIYTDGRSLPEDPQPAWMGYSVGKWEGDTFVVDTSGFNDTAWLDQMGHPRSESMRIEERYHRRDFGHMDLEIRFDDPKYYTRPFSIKAVLNLQPDSDVLEFVCNENERDRTHLAKQ